MSLTQLAEADTPVKSKNQMQLNLN